MAQKDAPRAPSALMLPPILYYGEHEVFGVSSRVRLCFEGKLAWVSSSLHTGGFISFRPETWTVICTFMKFVVNCCFIVAVWCTIMGHLQPNVQLWNI